MVGESVARSAPLLNGTPGAVPDRREAGSLTGMATSCVKWALCEVN
jgi:hypothetical protein